MKRSKTASLAISGTITGLNFENGGCADVVITVGEMVDLLQSFIKGKKYQKPILDKFDAFAKAFSLNYEKIRFRAVIAENGVEFIPIIREL